MADIDRPERITNITGLRAQPETPDSASGISRRPGRWPTVPCRLCHRSVWLLARACVCGMTDPARDGRRQVVAPAAAALAASAGVVGAWWWVARR
jgi:hypothetical protein